MTLLATLNVLLVGVWVGMYLFTTFVVSPAFKELYPQAGERSQSRQKVGRHYARVNGPLTALMLLVVGAQGMSQGWTAALWAELLLLLTIGALVILHVQRAKAEGTAPAWLTNLTLTASVLMCSAACASALEH